MPDVRPDIREVYEMVTKHKPADPGALERQRTRQVRTMRTRTLGALTLAASIVVAVVVLALRAGGDGPDRTAGVPTPAPEVSTHVDLYLIDPATGEAQPVLVEKGYQGDGEVSPDGTRVAFEGSDPDGYGYTQIFVREADGTVQQLTELVNSAYTPTWSPDGQQIAFSSSQDIFVMNADGTDVRRVTGSPGDDTDPDWSPDGRSIVFWSDEPRPGPSVFDLDGSEIWLGSVSDGSVTRLTRNRAADEHPSWSPDGEWIAFAGHSPRSLGGDFPGPRGLWLMRPDGTQRHRVFDDPDDSDWPTWSPDGRRIAYISAGLLNVVDVATGDSQVLWDEPVDLAWGPTGILVSAVAPDPGYRG